MSNTSDFVLKKEDHTIGNLLSEHLKLHPNVLMAGYKRMYHKNICAYRYNSTNQQKLATPTSPSSLSAYKQTVQCLRATSSHPSARSSSTSSRCCTRSLPENGSCGVSPTLASRATCSRMACNFCHPSWDWVFGVFGGVIGTYNHVDGQKKVAVFLHMDRSEIHFFFKGMILVGDGI